MDTRGASMGATRIAFLVCAILALWWSNAQGRPEIRTAFFNAYPGAVGSRLDSVSSINDHCGVCHFKFTGGGPRNPYGLAIEGALGSFPDDDPGRQAAILSIEDDDSDGDTYSNRIEIIEDLITFTNSPTFPGLTSANVGQAKQVDQADIVPYVTPTTNVDLDPPVVTVTYPVGGEMLPANATTTITYTATDASGIASIAISFSDDNGATWKPLARNLANDGAWLWFVPNLPGPNCVVRVEAVDGAGNPGSDFSPSNFTVLAAGGGRVPTTLRDMTLPGTQPLEGAVLQDANSYCGSCHGNYDTANEPWYNWRGSMMGQAMRDPLFLACMAVAEQDAPSVGDLCIRCHSPGGWQEGRSVDTTGGMITAKDRQSVQCDFCHRMVDFDYQEGISPAEDVAVLASVSPLPTDYSNGSFINDTGVSKRGPFDDTIEEGHTNLHSPFHTSSDLCGTCHDVSNPVFVKVGPGDYAPGTFDAEHIDMDLRNMFPIERTYSEWTQSLFAAGGVDLPQFGGLVSSCQDCHMRDVTAAGCNSPNAPVRSDMPLHDFMGANTFIPDILPDFYPTEVDVAQLSAAKTRAVATLQKAALLELTPHGAGVTARVTNDTGHKLPSGYPEGRRIWLNVEAFDTNGGVVFTSGAYDGSTGVLNHDEQIKVYEIKPGLSPGLANALSLPAGPSFHFVLNDTIYWDNRVPPRGFTNAGFESIQSPPVDYSYVDGQYWDDTDYALPAAAESVVVRVYYQTTTKEYVEFLRDENVTNSAGQDLYDAWAAHGRSTPELMAEAGVAVNVVTAVGEPQRDTQLAYALSIASPNPFSSRASFTFALPQPGQVRLEVFDVRGRRVRVLVDEIKPAARYEMRWDGCDDRQHRLAAGVYFLRFQAGNFAQTRKVLLMR